MHSSRKEPLALPLAFAAFRAPAWAGGAVTNDDGSLESRYGEAVAD